MKEKLLILAILAATSLIIFRNSFNVFFAQDDFILINHFSQNSIAEDFKNAIGKPQVTHWRPLHNLFFLTSGNLFGRNYSRYHILSWLILLVSAVAIFELIKKLLKDKVSAFIASSIYVSHPSHFISLYWISGNATLIGFMFLAWSIYFYTDNKKPISLLLYLVSLLASEAMILGAVLCLLISILKNSLKKDLVHLIIIFFVSTIFVLAKVLFLSSQETFDVYKVEISLNNLFAIKYYVLRIAGFAQTSGDKLTTFALLLWILVMGFFLFKSAAKPTHRKVVYISLLVIFVGLFPFILIPSHLSGHYMNISIFGFSLAVAIALKKQKFLTKLILMAIITIISFINVGLDSKNNWVVNRANLAKEILTDVGEKNLPFGSLLVFDDSQRATSLETYYALGTGEAIKFWFGDKALHTCFTFIDKCNITGPSVIR